MKRGVKWARIFKLFQEGKSTKEIIEMGFAARTVYWAKEQVEKGREPTRTVAEKEEWVTIYEKYGWFHECEDGRRAVIDRDEILTDEGVIKRLVCTGCGAVIKEKFERWTPQGKEAYASWKKRVYS